MGEDTRSTASLLNLHHVRFWWQSRLHIRKGFQRMRKVPCCLFKALSGVLWRHGGVLRQRRDHLLGCMSAQACCWFLSCGNLVFRVDWSGFAFRLTFESFGRQQVLDPLERRPCVTILPAMFFQALFAVR